VRGEARDALASALDKGMDYTGLRDFTPDPKLFHYLPPALAAREQVVPVILVGDTLKIASARPDPDLSLVRTRFPYLQLAIVMAPITAIEQALQRLPGAPANS
jgi:hypothetical protein